ncbi:MAG: putative small lipoprotein YifL [Cellvibrionaceae bacterium]|jgi:predicted small lipoprotein YifL
MKKSILLLFTGIVLLVACGQTGPLVLPAGENEESSENKAEELDRKAQKK